MFSQSTQSTQFDRAAHCRRIASAGGRQTVSRHGRGHMARIGARGWRATTDRYFAGLDQLHRQWLATVGAYQTWRASGLAMKRDRHGRGIWPETMPAHPARLTGPGQLGLWESRHAIY